MRAWFPLLGLTGIAVAAGLAPLTSPASAAVSSTVAATAYVANSGSSSVDAIDTATNMVIATVKVGPDPAGVVVTKNGTTAYAVSPNCGKCRRTGTGVYPISTATNKAGKVIDPLATKIALDPNGVLLCALNGNSDSVTLINTTTGKARKPIKIKGSPDAIAFTPNGRFAYLTTTSPATVVSINTGNGHVRTPIKIGGHPTGIALSTSGEEGYVIDSGKVIPVHTSTNSAGKPIAAANQVITPHSGGFVLALASHSVFPISIETGPGTAVSVGKNPVYVAISPSGRLAYVVSKGSDTVTPIHINIHSFALTAGPPIAVGSAPEAVAFTPDGSTAYVTNSGAGTVTPIDVKTGQPGLPVKVGSAPGAIAITP
jgi:YVTN family beta-propeller protein